MMKNYFGCNECCQMFFKGWKRDSDNLILKSPKTKEQRKKMMWWVGDEEFAQPLSRAIEDGYMESWCDECNAFTNSVIEPCKEIMEELK